MTKTETIRAKLQAAHKAEMTKLAKIGRFAARAKKLNTRKENPLSDAAFCQKYEINTPRFNRIKNLKEYPLPSDGIIDGIDRAFTAEGV